MRGDHVYIPSLNIIEKKREEKNTLNNLYSEQRIRKKKEKEGKNKIIIKIKNKLINSIIKKRKKEMLAGLGKFLLVLALCLQASLLVTGLDAQKNFNDNVASVTTLLP